MIKIILALLLLAIFGCSSEPEKERPLDRLFYSSEKIVQKFKHLSLVAIDSLSITGKSHLEHTVSIDSFFPEEKINHIKLKRLMKSLSTAPLTGKGEIDLRSQSTPVVSQWDGTCSAHGLTAAIETTLADPFQKLSERHVWSGYRTYSCEAAIKEWSGTDDCITLNSAWPHGSRIPYPTYKMSHNCFTYLKATTYIEDDLQKMINALDQDHAVYLAISVTKSMLNCDTALDPNSSTTGGGHGLAIVGYKLDASVKGGGYFIIKNSWGTGCADNGYQYVPFYYCQRGDMYCMMWTIDSVTSVSSGASR